MKVDTVISQFRPTPLHRCLGSRPYKHRAQDSAVSQLPSGLLYSCTKSLLLIYIFTKKSSNQNKKESRSKFCTTFNLLYLIRFRIWNPSGGQVTFLWWRMDLQICQPLNPCLHDLQVLHLYIIINILILDYFIYLQITVKFFHVPLAPGRVQYSILISHLSDSRSSIWCNA